ncbi:MAG TPA: DHH family phosphoesterase [Candidatus Cloacimonadota bacterium]|nr:DHH family phosphoesterase [Candidatus Cloacimonadota bacterium]
MIFNDLDSYKDFLSKHDPLLFDGHLSLLEMKTFSEFAKPSLKRVIKAVESHERILIFGHDDADGITSLYIMYDYLKQTGCDLLYYLPNREIENHGIRENVIRYAIENQVKLMIVVDNGISSVDGVDRLNQAGIDCVILDHHLIPEKLPEACAILNPKLFNGDNEEHATSLVTSDLKAEKLYQGDLKMLAGVGVCFFFLHCLNQHFKNIELKEEYLFWTAIGSIADRVPMTGVNHLIVRQLLNEWDKCTVSPLIEFISGKSGSTATHQEKILFLNSLIRFFYFGRQLNGSHLCFSFLLSESREAMENYYNQLMVLKDENQVLTDTNEAIINQEVIQMIDRIILENASECELLHKEVNKQLHLFYRDKQLMSVVYVDYQGRLAYSLIGRLAGNLVNRYHCPVMILQTKHSPQSAEHHENSAQTTQMVCEARCLDGFHWLNCFNSFADILVNFGGHVKAAGFLMNTENLTELISRYHQYLNQYIASTQTAEVNKQLHSVKKTEYHAVLKYSPEIWKSLLDFYEACLPYGEGFSESVFCISNDMSDKDLLKSCIENREYFVNQFIFDKIAENHDKINEIVLTASNDWNQLKVLHYQ